MKRSRVCLKCGRDTCMCTQYLESHYGFMVVRCANCGSVRAVRKESGTAAWWRGFCRARDAAISMGLRLAGLMSIVFFTCAFMLLAQDSLGSYRLTPHGLLSGTQRGKWWMDARQMYEAGEGFVVLGMILMPAGGGAWIGLMLRHGGVLRSWMIISAMIIVMSQMLGWIANRGQARGDGAVAVNMGVMSLVAICVMLAATPLGTVLNSLWREISRLRYGWMLRRARKRRRA